MVASMASLAPIMDLDSRYQHYRERLRAFMKGRNLTNDIVAEKLGESTHTVTVSKLRNGKLDLSDRWRSRIADAFNIDHDDLFGFGPLPKPVPSEIVRRKRRGRKAAIPDKSQAELPIYGWAAGSAAGVETVAPDPVDYISCPPSLLGVDGAYALRTRGESMAPRYFPGEILFVHPHKTLRSGDHVVIQTQRFEGSGTETWVKRFDSQDAENIYASQYNPQAKIVFRKTQVAYIHRVLRADELL